MNVITQKLQFHASYKTDKNRLFTFLEKKKKKKTWLKKKGYIQSYTRLVIRKVHIAVSRHFSLLMAENMYYEIPVSIFQ